MTRSVISSSTYETVLNMVLMMRFTKRLFWKLFISTTCFQYAATSGKPWLSQMYTRFSTSFWKQLPPKPTDALRNLLPTRLSLPMQCDTCRAVAVCGFRWDQ